MTHLGYLVAGYGLTVAVLLGYVLRLRWRARALARSSAAWPSAPPGNGGDEGAGAPAPADTTSTR